MSKVFEALQRLERESGNLLPRVSTEAQRILQSETATVSAKSQAGEEPETVGSTATPPAAAVTPETPELEHHSDVHLEQIPAEEATIAPSSRIVYYTEPDSPAADRFRLLRMRLWPLWESGKLSSLVITSPQAGDGKSTVALNLATALAEQGKRRVLLIEGDLHHPSLTQRLQLSPRSGLAECLETSLDPLAALRRVEPLGIYLLPSGESKSNPTELLQSPALPKLIERLQHFFDWILVDTPPAVPLTDTLSFRDSVDACLLVVRADLTPRDAVEAAVARVGKNHLIGMLLNGSEEVDQMYSGYRKSHGRGSRGKANRKKHLG